MHIIISHIQKYNFKRMRESQHEHETAQQDF